MSYESYKDFRLVPEDNGCWSVLNSDYESRGTYPSKAAAKRAVDQLSTPVDNTEPVPTIDEIFIQFLRDCGYGEEIPQWPSVSHKRVKGALDTARSQCERICASERLAGAEHFIEDLQQEMFDNYDNAVTMKEMDSFFDEWSKPLQTQLEGETHGRD